MQLSPIVEGIRGDLLKAAAVGDEETKRIAQILVASVEPSIGLRVLDALHEAARELAESAPGCRVEVRLDGRDPVLHLVTPEPEGTEEPQRRPEDLLAGYIDDELSRLTLRLPEGLKSQVEQLAVRGGASINSWIVAALAHAIDLPGESPPSRRLPRRLRGYVQG